MNREGIPLTRSPMEYDAAPHKTQGRSLQKTVGTPRKTPLKRKIRKLLLIFTSLQCSIVAPETVSMHAPAPLPPPQRANLLKIR